MNSNDRTVKLSPREVFVLRRMSDKRRAERIAQFVMRLVERTLILEVVILLALMLASCNPYAELYPTSAPTARASAQTATAAAIITATATAAPTARASAQCTVTTGAPVGYLNLRTGAGVQFAIIRVLAEGEVLTVIHVGAWHEVTDAQGHHGYINSNYCEAQ